MHKLAIDMATANKKTERIQTVVFKTYAPNNISGRKLNYSIKFGTTLSNLCMRN